VWRIEDETTKKCEGKEEKENQQHTDLDCIGEETMQQKYYRYGVKKRRHKFLDQEKKYNSI